MRDVTRTFLAVAFFAGTSLLFVDVSVAEHKLPTVLIATLVRNKGHSLPYFFSFIHNLDYPKERIALWIRSDHNEDDSDDIIRTWHANASHAYHSVHINDVKKEPTKWPGETSNIDWPAERHAHIIESKEAALRYARNMWADFIFFIDADVYLSNPETLKYLIDLNLPVVAPMLLSDGLYSNFWAGMTSNFYYQRTPEYKEIYEFKKVGEFSVPMIHSAVLINLRDPVTDALTFNVTFFKEQAFHNGDEHLINELIPQDDIIVLAVSANYSNIPLKVSNALVFGYISVPLDAEDPEQKDLFQLTNLKIMMINDIGRGIDVLEVLTQFISRPYIDTLTLDKIVMINLERRPDRREKMENNFMELGLRVELLPAVDGSQLSEADIEHLGVKFLEGYADPYHNRPMTMGEIGCFLSHYRIWEEMVKRDLKEVLILEDDIRFDTYFKERALNLIYEARKIGGWDLIYFGRKRLQNRDENYVGDSWQLVHASYSYWTLGYVLSIAGAQKLLDAKPLEKMVPVDEFLPIMFDQHINMTWKEAFPNRNLVAWSAAPLIIFPTHYIGDPGYVSDTEDSILVNIENDSLEKKGRKENYVKPVASSSADSAGLHGETQLDDIDLATLSSTLNNNLDKNEL